MSDQEIRLECLKEAIRLQAGTIDDVIVAARKAAEFVISGGDRSPRQGSQHKG